MYNIIETIEYMQELQENSKEYLELRINSEGDGSIGYEDWMGDGSSPWFETIERIENFEIVNVTGRADA